MQINWMYVMYNFHNQSRVTNSVLLGGSGGGPKMVFLALCDVWQRCRCWTKGLRWSARGGNDRARMNMTSWVIHNLGNSHKLMKWHYCILTMTQNIRWIPNTLGTLKTIPTTSVIKTSDDQYMNDMYWVGMMVHLYMNVFILVVELMISLIIK